jgi:hypothetical protein
VAVRRAPVLGSARIGSRTLWQLLIYVALTTWTAAVVLAHSSGRMETGRALIFLAIPIVVVGAALRPAWVVLFLAVAPVAQIQIAPTRALALLLLITLVGQLVVRGGVSVGWRSGFLGLIVLLAAALVFRADLTGRDALVARGFLNNLGFYAFLGLVAFNATRIGDLRGRQLVNAIQFGLMLGVILEYTVLSDEGGILGSSAAPLGRPTAYLAAAGFAITFARLIIRAHGGGYYHPAAQVVLGAGFLMAMIPGLDRGAWLSALIAVLLISLWAGKKQYWLLILVALIVMIAVPVARQRVVPNEQQTAGYTTGRWELWTQLWEEIDSGLPFGNGFGHTITLTSEELFGPGVATFAPEPDVFVYPHNDFLFWMVEFGVLGLFGMLLFWGQLLRAFRVVSRSASTNTYFVQTLSGVLVVGLVTQLVGSTFFFTALAVPFFIVAGFVFGARELVPKRLHSQTLERSPVSR